MGWIIKTAVYLKDWDSIPEDVEANAIAERAGFELKAALEIIFRENFHHIPIFEITKTYYARNFAAYYIEDMLKMEPWESWNHVGITIHVKDDILISPDRLKNELQNLLWNGCHIRLSALETVKLLNGKDTEHPLDWYLQQEYVNLACTDFSNYHGSLSFINFAQANLRKANFADQNMQFCNFTQANLSGADLSRAILRNAILERANLRDANLTEADVTEANLRGADLTNANFSKANLTGAILKKLKIRGVNFKDAKLPAEFASRC